MADFGANSATDNASVSTWVQRATVNRTALAWHKKRRLTGPSGEESHEMLVLESPARSAPAAGSPHMLAGIPQQRLALGPTCPCRALRRQRHLDAADTRPQSHRPRRSRRRARGRISRPFLPAQSSSTQAPLPTPTEVHATRGRVYSLDSELRLPACGTDNNSHSPAPAATGEWLFGHTPSLRNGLRTGPSFFTFWKKPQWSTKGGVSLT